MTETYLIAPSINENELLRTFSRFGKNTLGVRVVGAYELALDALARMGVPAPAHCLTGDEETALISGFLNQIGYFSSGTYADAADVAGALRTLRNLVTNEDEAAGIREQLKTENPRSDGFPVKNQAIYDAYCRYMAALGERTDRIGTIRLAISEAVNRRHGKADGMPVFDADFVVLEEFRPTLLEQQLIRVLSGREVTPIPFLTFVGKTPDEKAGSFTYTAAYGAVNEVEDILKCISDSGKPLDTVTIACAEPTGYARLFFGHCARHGIPVTLSQGLKITSTRPADLLRLIYDWETAGSHGTDALTALLFSPCFDRRKLAEDLDIPKDGAEKRLREMALTAGSLRIDFNTESDRRKIDALKTSLTDRLGLSIAHPHEHDELIQKMTSLDDVEKLVRLPDFSIVGLIRRYTFCRKDKTAGPYDRAALQIITDSLSAFAQGKPDDLPALGQYIPHLLNKTVCPSVSREGALHITTVEGALASLRRELFICGLSAADFPGTPVEDHLLLDMDLEGPVWKKWEMRPDSYGRVERRSQDLRDLVAAAQALGVPVHFSYSDYDLAELKDRNPSSVLLGIWLEQHQGQKYDAFDKSLRRVGFFDNRILTRTVVPGENGDDGMADSGQDAGRTGSGAPDLLQREWSPSSIGMFFECPRRFELKYVRGFRDSSPDDPLDVLRTNDTGNMAHRVMQYLADHQDQIDNEDAGRFAGQVFDDCMAERPPIDEKKAAKEKERFINMMKNAADDEVERGNTVLGAEEKLGASISGVKIGGYTDRIEQDPHGAFCIADFKTNSRVRHKQDDVDSCLQALLYAYMWDQAHPDRPVSYVEFRYLRYRETVCCRCDDQTVQQLEDKMKVFCDALVGMDFGCAADKKRDSKDDDPCKFCNFKHICRKPGDTAGKEAMTNDNE